MCICIQQAIPGHIVIILYMHQTVIPLASSTISVYQRSTYTTSHTRSYSYSVIVTLTVSPIYRYTYKITVILTAEFIYLQHTKGIIYQTFHSRSYSQFFLYINSHLSSSSAISTHQMSFYAHEYKYLFYNC